jgi:hypothetical protein
VRFKLRPSDDTFYEISAGRAEPRQRDGAAVGAGPARRRRAVVSERLADVEHDSDQITHELYNKINSYFITPFDRADIYSLGSRLDDVMDHLEAVGNLVYLYGLTSCRRCRARCTSWSTCSTSRPSSPPRRCRG